MKTATELAELYVAQLQSDHSNYVIQLVKEGYLTAYTHSAWVREADIEAKYWRATRRDLRIVGIVCFLGGILIGKI